MTGSYVKDITRLVREFEKAGLDVRLSGSNRYIVQLPDGGTVMFNLNTDPSAMDQQRKKVIAAGLAWPLDPKPRVRKSRTTPTPTPEPEVETETTVAETPHVGTLKVTPKIAEEFLERNTQNRTLSDVVVKKYARDMKDGAWHYDASPIRFDVDGELIDGQHRMWAVIESNTTQEFLIVRGLPKRAFTTIDTGKKRSLADVLTIQHPGLSNGSHIAAMTTIITKYENGMRGIALRANRTSVLSTDELMEFFAKNREAIEENIKGARAVRDRLPAVTMTSVGLARWVFMNIDPEDAGDFFAKLASGAGLDEGDPILALRNYLFREASRSKTALPLDVATAVFIKAWNAYRRGDKIKLLAYKPGGATPERFPEAI